MAGSWELTFRALTWADHQLQACPPDSPFPWYRSLRGERARLRCGSPLDYARTGPPQGMEEKEPAPDFPRDEELLAHPLAAEVAQPLAL